MVLTSVISELTIFLLTWNVKDGEPMESLLNAINVTEEKPDIFAIGFQEIKFNLLNYFTKGAWVSHLESILKEFDYVQIKSIRLVGMLLVLFVKKDNLPLIKNIRTTYTKTGFGGILGNKGGVAISFEISSTSIVIINSHFYPYDDKYDRRIEDYKNIALQEFYKTNTTKISDHDYIFWVGDLNFRLDNLTNEYITQKIAEALENDREKQKEIWNELLQYDQLKKSMRTNEAFEGYSESSIDFQPTYKFKPFTNEYDPHRRPAWCDRILYKVNGKSENEKKLELKIHHYSSHNHYKQSDHKPVSSMISIKLVKSKSLIDTRLSFQPVGQWNTKNKPKVYYVVKDDEDERVLKRSVQSDVTDISLIEEDLFPNEDWIGLYPADFTSLNDFVDLVFANLSYPVTMATEAIDYDTGDFSDMKRYEVDFPDIIDKKPGDYRLLYINKYSEVLSMSNVFLIEN